MQTTRNLEQLGRQLATLSGAHREEYSVQDIFTGEVIEESEAARRLGYAV